MTALERVLEALRRSQPRGGWSAYEASLEHARLQPVAARPGDLVIEWISSPKAPKLRVLVLVRRPWQAQLFSAGAPDVAGLVAHVALRAKHEGRHTHSVAHLNDSRRMRGRPRKEAP